MVHPVLHRLIDRYEDGRGGAHAKEVYVEHVKKQTVTTHMWRMMRAVQTDVHVRTHCPCCC